MSWNPGSTNPKPNPYIKPIPVVSALEIPNRPRPEYVIEDLIMERSVNVLVGPSGSAKTFLALTLARSIMTGTPWCGRTVKEGKVLYICAEGREGLPLRLKALFAHHQDDEVKTAPMLHGVEEDLSLSDSDIVDRLCHLIWSLNASGTPVRLVIIDTLARCVGDFDENVSRDMTKLVKSLDTVCASTGTSVLLIHHTSKDGRAERGSGALRCASSSLMKIEPVTGATGTFVLSCKKQKERELMDKMYFRLMNMAESAVLVPAQPPAGGSMSSGSRQIAKYLILAELEKQGEMRHKQLQEALGSPKGTIGSALKDLLEEGLVEQKKPGRPYSRVKA